MNYIISASTDVGIKRKNNQDSLSVKILNTTQGKMAFAIMCDGMGGLQKGEVASASLVNAFDEWLKEEFPKCLGKEIEDYMIRTQWETIISSMNEKIKTYGQQNNVKLGTTAVVMLLTEKRYYILNVGDSRAYEITADIEQITNDQTLIEREVAMGNLTREEADKDSRKNVLLQCVGASKDVYPEMHFGETKKDAVYMLCSDGFRHQITEQDMWNELNPQINMSEADLENHAMNLIDLNKQRKETDNISIALIKTF